MSCSRISTSFNKLQYLIENIYLCTFRIMNVNIGGLIDTYCKQKKKKNGVSLCVILPIEKIQFANFVNITLLFIF